MKGVALGICPDATFVDITHDIPPHDVLAGALELAASYKYFPPGTIFLVVVDPGVGSLAVAIAAEAGGYRFVAPDNGVLTLVFKETPPKRVVELTSALRAADGQPHVRGTRSVCACGRLAREGDRAGGARAPADDVAACWRCRSRSSPRRRSSARCCASIASAIWSPTSIAGRSSTSPAPAASRSSLAPHAVGKVVATYAEAEPGAVCALFGSTEHLEIAVNGGSAAERLGARARRAESRSRVRH